jgi:Beta-glucanase/Beta-glucan synthetase
MKPSSRLVLRRTGIVSACILLGIFFFLAFSGFAFPEDTDKQPIANTTSQTGKTAVVPVYVPSVTSGVLKTATGGWQLVWDEEFSGKDLDIKKWSAIDRKINYNNEVETYIPQNVEIKDGHLNLTAVHNTGSSPEYTSGMVDTKDKFSMLYGKVSIGLKLLKGRGFFPAVWMLPESENYAEVDIMENLGSNPSEISGGHHYQANGKKLEDIAGLSVENPMDFHEYSVEWFPDELTWSIDRKPFFTCKSNIPQERMYIIMDLAILGDVLENTNDSARFPNSFAVDYIKVYSKN